MPKEISLKIVILSFGVLVICFATAFYVVAWQEPAQAPPDGNVPAPLNAGATGQSKAGGLILNTSGAPNGLIVDKGNLCLGDDCRSEWPAAGGTTIVSSPSCPNGYSQAMKYYEPRTCSSQLCDYNPYTGQVWNCQLYSQCTTPSGWGLALTPLYYDFVTNDYFPSYPNGSVRSLQAIPGCQYQVVSGYRNYGGYVGQITICYASTVSKSLCIPDNP